MAAMKRLKLDYFALYWTQIFYLFFHVVRVIRVSSGALDPYKQWYVRTHKRDEWYVTDSFCENGATYSVALQ